MQEHLSTPIVTILTILTYVTQTPNTTFTNTDIAKHEQNAHLLAGMCGVFGTVLPFLASFSVLSGLVVDEGEPLGARAR